MFYTYAHYTPEGRPFYVGKGQRKRAYKLDHRNSKWKNIVAKYGSPMVEILARWSTEADALEHEKFLIACFKDMGYDLANLTIGGEGTSGYKHTFEQIEKNRQAKIGTTPWNKGIPSGLKHTDEFKEKIRRVHTGSKYNLGRPTSEKQKQIASQLSKGNKYAAGNTNNRKWKWVGTHTKTGEVITFIGSQVLNEAGFQHANVIKCINGRRKSHKGYVWHKELLENK